MVDYGTEQKDSVVNASRDQRLLRKTAAVNSDINVTKAVDSASNQLWHAAIDSTAVFKVQIDFVKSNTNIIYQEFFFQNAMVSSISVGGSSGGSTTPMEALKFNFGRMSTQ